MATGIKTLISPLTISAVQAEATRAHLLHGDNSIYYANADRALTILTEEVGEVAKEINDAIVQERYIDRDNIEKEFIQVAAMALTMLEAINHPDTTIYTECKS